MPVCWIDRNGTWFSREREKSLFFGAAFADAERRQARFWIKGAL